MTQENIIKLSNGYFMLAILLLLIIGGVFSLINSIILLFIAFLILLISIIPGFFLVNPNTSKVLLLFGKYIGTVKENGFYWANPFYTKKSISLRASNFDSERVK